MTALNYESVRRNTAKSRPVIAAPTLSVVKSPVPSRGYFSVVIACALLLLVTLFGAFYLNTKMVQGAYEIKTIKVELEEIESTVDTLQGELITLSTPEILQEKAKTYGMLPASQTKYVDVETGLISGSAKR